MAERVFWHVGLPKTGTTYLQEVLWANRDSLAAQGITMPGFGHREHLWAALDMQGDRSLAGRHRDAPGSWERLCVEIDKAPGTALLSHEFFAAAETDEVVRALERLAPAQVHLVITARDAAGMLAAGWQEDVKNGSARDLASAAVRESRGHFGWWIWDLESVLRRWLPAVPAERIHVLPVPDRAEGADQHWINFARTIGFEGDCVMPERAVNQSIGVVQIEALRRVNAHLTGFEAALQRGKWLRGYLGENHLARQSGERLRLDTDLFASCQERSSRAVQLIQEEGIDVVGDLSRLLGPPEPTGKRAVASVSDAEVADSLAELVGSMLHDVRDNTRNTTATAKGNGPGQIQRGSRVTGLRSRVRSLLGAGPRSR